MQSLLDKRPAPLLLAFPNLARIIDFELIRLKPPPLFFFRNPNHSMQVRNGYGNTTLRNSYDAVVATMHAQLKVGCGGRCCRIFFCVHSSSQLLVDFYPLFYAPHCGLFLTVACPHSLPPPVKAQTVDLRDVSEVPDPSTGHTSQNQGGGGVGQHDSVSCTFKNKKKVQ